MSGIGEHSGHLRKSIGVIELFLNDPAWKQPKTAEKSAKIFLENHRCNREITVHFFEFEDFRQTKCFAKQSDEK